MIGNDLDSFWRQTDRTFQLAFYADHEREILDYNKRISIAWQTAALAKAKKMPRLSTLEIKRPSRGKKSIPWQAKVEGLKRWHAAVGGKFIKAGENV
jgi:hypothetical protein